MISAKRGCRWCNLACPGGKVNLRVSPRGLGSKWHPAFTPSDVTVTAGKWTKHLTKGWPQKQEQWRKIKSISTLLSLYLFFLYDAKQPQSRKTKITSHAFCFSVHIFCFLIYVRLCLLFHASRSKLHHNVTHQSLRQTLFEPTRWQLWSSKVPCVLVIVRAAVLLRLPSYR